MHSSNITITITSIKKKTKNITSMLDALRHKKKKQIQIQ